MATLSKQPSSNVFLKCIQSSADLIETELSVKSAPGSPKGPLRTSASNRSKQSAANRQSCEAVVYYYPSSYQCQASIDPQHNQKLPADIEVTGSEIYGSEKENYFYTTNSTNTNRSKAQRLNSDGMEKQRSGSQMENESNFRLLSEQGHSEPHSPVSCFPKTVFSENAFASKLLALVSTERLASTSSTPYETASISNLPTPCKGNVVNGDCQQDYYKINSAASSEVSKNKIRPHRNLTKVSLPLLSDNKSYQNQSVEISSARYLSTQSARSSPLTSLATPGKSPGSPKVVQFNLEATTVQSYDKYQSSQIDHTQVSQLLIFFHFLCLQFHKNCFSMNAHVA